MFNDNDYHNELQALKQFLYENIISQKEYNKLKESLAQKIREELGLLSVDNVAEAVKKDNESICDKDIDIIHTALLAETDVKDFLNFIDDL